MFNSFYCATGHFVYRRTISAFLLLPSSSSPYPIVDLKRQNHVKVETDKPKLKVKVQSESDDNVWKRLLEKPLFELASKCVFRL